MMIFLIILILKIIRRSKNFIYNQLYSRKQDFLTLPLSLELSFIFLRLRFHVYEHLWIPGGVKRAVNSGMLVI